MAAAPRLRFCFGNAAAAADRGNHAHAGCGARARRRQDGTEGRVDKTRLVSLWGNTFFCEEFWELGTCATRRPGHTMVPSSKPWDDSRSLDLTIRRFAWEARAAADHVCLAGPTRHIRRFHGHEGIPRPLHSNVHACSRGCTHPPDGEPAGNVVGVSRCGKKREPRLSAIRRLCDSMHIPGSWFVKVSKSSYKLLVVAQDCIGAWAKGTAKYRVVEPRSTTADKEGWLVSTRRGPSQ